MCPGGKDTPCWSESQGYNKWVGDVFSSNCIGARSEGGCVSAGTGTAVWLLLKVRSADAAGVFRFNGYLQARVLPGTYLIAA